MKWRLHHEGTKDTKEDFSRKGAKHALSKVEGAAKEKSVVISTPSARLRVDSGRNPCFEQSEKSSSYIPRNRSG